MCHMCCFCHHQGLIRDGANLVISDPEVTSEQIFRDLSTPKFEWDRPNYSKSASTMLDNVQVRLAVLGPPVIIPWPSLWRPAVDRNVYADAPKPAET